MRSKFTNNTRNGFSELSLRTEQLLCVATVETLSVVHRSVLSPVATGKLLWSCCHDRGHMHVGKETGGEKTLDLMDRALEFLGD
jgi:hypothetical protein